MASLIDDRPDVEWCDHPECRPIYARYRRQGPISGVRDGSFVLEHRVRGRACHQPLRLVMSCGRIREKACGVRDSDACPPCAEIANRRVRRKFEEGMRTLDGWYLYLVTFTCPGSSGHHRYIPGVAGDHGVCGCELKVSDVGEWNQRAASAWNWMRTRLVERYPGVGYARVCEVQDGKRRADGRGRGALHHHVLLALPEKIDVSWLHERALAVGYGCVLDVEPVRDPAAVAAYVAKYLTKGGRDRRACKWSVEVIDRQTGEVTREGAYPTYRAWSASKGFGPTIASLRELAMAQARARDASLRELGIEPLTSIGGVWEWPADLPPP